jgi:SAM-dependent methyltransferase
MAPATAPAGAGTMSPAMRDMQAYCRYLFRLVQPALGRRVWEIGVGYGQYTSLLREAGKSVLATDIDEQCLRGVQARFPNDPQVVTARVDLTDEAAVRRQSWFQADSVMCLNVLEHIEDHVSALTWLRESAAPGSRLGLIVPALPRLYGRMDEEAGHFRRYTRAALRQVLDQAGWTVLRLRYVNLLGAVGWWYHNRVRSQAGLGDPAVNRQMRAADRWLPRIARLTDPLCGAMGGLSVVAIAESLVSRSTRIAATPESPPEGNG